MKQPMEERKKYKNKPEYRSVQKFIKIEIKHSIGDKTSIKISKNWKRSMINFNLHEKITEITYTGRPY